MNLENLNKAFELMDNYRDKCYVSGPKSEILINKAEHILGNIFPLSYRLFLKKYGFGGIGSLEINGLIDEDLEKPCESNVVWFNLEERNSGMPETFVIIASTGFGPQYVLDTSQNNYNKECPVLLWVRGALPILTEKVAENFGDFLLQQVQQALSEDEE